MKAMTRQSAPRAAMAYDLSRLIAALEGELTAGRLSAPLCEPLRAVLRDCGVMDGNVLTLPSRQEEYGEAIAAALRRE
jgi:hypothetical protein